MRSYYIISLLIIFIATSCIDKINLDPVDSPKLLVVDGSISNGEGPYDITLSYTSGYNTDPNYYQPNEPVNNAIVKIHNYSTFGVTSLKLTEDGVYTTNSGFQPQIDQKYFLEITIGDKVYESSVETIDKAPSIDSIFYEKIENSSDVGLYINLKDNSTPNEYYQWIWDGYYQLLTSPPIEPDTFDCCNVCYVPAKSTKINILSDRLINGSSLNKFLVESIPVVGQVGPTDFLINVMQLKISEQYYDYLSLLKTQINSDGGLFDPLPFRLVGNIKNINDNDEVVLGYFSVFGVSNKHIKIIRGQYSQVPPYYKNEWPDCRLAIPNSNATLVPPENWN